MENRLAVFVPKSQKARVILALFGFAFFGTLIFLSSRSRTSYPTQIILSENAAKRQRLQELQKDSDADGLKEWEEAIFRTDPKDPDTDGDGTRDGDEIAQGRDPLVAGPHDGLARQNPADSQEPRADVQTNLTALVAQKFGERIIIPQLANPAAVPDADAAAFQIANELLAREQDAVQQFRERDIIITPDNSPRRIEQYAKTFQALVARHFNNLSDTSEIAIFADALQNNDFDQLFLLEPYIRAHANLRETLRAIPVPSEFTTLHLSYLNTLRHQENAVIKMKNAEQDLIGAIVAASGYADNLNTFERIEQQFQEELRKRSIAVRE